MSKSEIIFWPISKIMRIGLAFAMTHRMIKVFRQSRDNRAGFLEMSIIAVLCAVGMSVLGNSQPLPVLGDVSLLAVTLGAIALGWPLLSIIQSRGIGTTTCFGVTRKQVLLLIACGAALALPPIAIDLAMPFPKDSNVPLPQAWLFYPAIALVAEVFFHLLPLALLVLLMPADLRAAYLLGPVVFVEALFQAQFATGSALQSVLVFGNVSLVSAVGLWLFNRYGFAAMMSLRLAFYLFWHIAWGTLRVPILF